MSPPESKCGAGLFCRSALRWLCVPKRARHLQAPGAFDTPTVEGGASLAAATFTARANLSARKGDNVLLPCGPHVWFGD